MRRSLLVSFVLALAPAAAGQTVQPLVSEGDTVIGVGAVTTFNPQYLGLTDDRMWTLIVDTDFSDVQQDVVLLRNGFVTLREGASMIEPAGSTLNQFVSVDLADDGDLGLILSTRGPTSTGVYWNLIRVADLDSPIDSPDLGADTKWVRPQIVKINGANTMLVAGDINNTAWGSNPNSREDALIRYELDDLGNVLSTTVLATDGMFNATLGTTIDGWNSLGEHLLALNERGDFLMYVTGFGISGQVMLNMDTVVAQELSPSSVVTPWRSNGLAQTKLDLNDIGDVVVTGALQGDANDTTTYLIEKNGERFVRAGDVIDGYSTSPLAAGRAAPIRIANTGHVFWRAETQAGEAAYLRDYTPIVKSGETVVGGNLVLDLPPNQNAFAISRDGRYFLGRIQELQSIGEASVLVDFGLVLDVPGCAGNAGRLLHREGEARLGQTLQLAMDEGQEAGALPVILFSTRPRVPGSECGVMTPFGELLISPGHRVASLFLNPWNGTSPVAVNVPIPTDPALVDLALWAQGIFRDATGPAPEPYRLTNALRIEVGAP